MGLFSHSEAADQYEQVYGAQKKHHSSWTHELIAGAAGFAAMHAFEKHQSENGKPANWAVAKELLAAFAAAEVDKLAETKGMDAISREKAKKQAIAQAHHLADEKHAAGEI